MAFLAFGRSIRRDLSERRKDEEKFEKEVREKRKNSLKCFETASHKVAFANTEFSGILSHCHWMNGTVHDWIFKVPVLTVMALNSVFLVMIMWVS
ncbi:hypothetical protein RUM44_009678 [Polyplax serrata]|uniref:Uncharacterized protein n=1 Tax=Polyplax serrata TaxID=468196 RepID=A0ABR1ATZ2_POLSC